MVCDRQREKDETMKKLSQRRKKEKKIALKRQSMKKVRRDFYVGFEMKGFRVKEMKMLAGVITDVIFFNSPTPTPQGTQEENNRNQNRNHACSLSHSLPSSFFFISFSTEHELFPGMPYVISEGTTEEECEEGLIYLWLNNNNKDGRMKEGRESERQRTNSIKEGSNV